MKGSSSGDVCLHVVCAAYGIIGTGSVGLDRDTIVESPRSGRAFEIAVLNNVCRVTNLTRASLGTEEEDRKGESKRLELDHCQIMNEGKNPTTAEEEAENTQLS